MDLSPLSQALAFAGVKYINPKSSYYKAVQWGPHLCRRVITSTLAAGASEDFNTTKGSNAPQLDILATGNNRPKGVIMGLGCAIETQLDTPAKVFELFYRLCIEVVANGTVISVALGEIMRLAGVPSTTANNVTYVGGCPTGGRVLWFDQAIMFGLGPDDAIRVRNNDEAALATTGNVNAALYVYGPFADAGQAQDFTDDTDGSIGTPCKFGSEVPRVVAQRQAQSAALGLLRA